MKNCSNFLCDNHSQACEGNCNQLRVYNYPKDCESRKRYNRWDNYILRFCNVEWVKRSWKEFKDKYYGRSK